MPGQADAQSIHKQSPGLILLRRIRDEAHRFAIAFQKQKRTASISTSVFHEIPGMGEKRVKKLLRKYKDIQKIAGLKPEEIQKDMSLSNAIAKEIIKNSKVNVFLVNDEIQLAKFVKQNIYGKKIVIGMGAGSISSWIRNLPKLI